MLKDDVCNDALNWAFAIRMPPHPKLLLLDLADHKNSITKLCCPSLKSIQERTGLNRVQILHYSDCLRTAGVIRIEKGGKRQVNRYFLNVTATFCEPLRFTRPPRRGSRGYPVTRTNPKENHNDDAIASPGPLREPAREHSAEMNSDGIQSEVASSRPSGKTPRTEANTVQPDHRQQAPVTPPSPARSGPSGQVVDFADRLNTTPDNVLNVAGRLGLDPDLVLTSMRAEHGWPEPNERDRELWRDRFGEVCQAMLASAARAKWPTYKMRGYAQKRGVDPAEAAKFITDEYGHPPLDQLADNTAWARAFYSVVEAMAGGFLDAIIASGLDLYGFDDDETACEEGAV
jgi:hypothetical protein